MGNRRKKGISSLLAIVFLIPVVFLGLNVLNSGILVQKDLGEVVKERSVMDAERSSEQIRLRDVQILNNKFDLTIANTGSLPVKLVRMWVTNITDPNGWHQYYELDEIVNPTQTTNIGDALPLVAMDSASYDISVVTERGTTASFQILSAFDKPLKMNLLVIPTSIQTGNNATILLIVTNNLTDGSVVKSLIPTINWTATEAQEGSTNATATLLDGPNPVSEPNLSLAETTFFKWVYKIEGDEDDTVRFNATLANASVGNYATETLTVVPAVTELVRSIVSSSIGLLTMNFTSFEFCEPEPSTIDCTPDSSDWKPAWKINTGEHILRVNVTNTGDSDILLDAWTAALLLRAQEDGGGNLPTDMYILGDPTESDEDGSPYENYSKIIHAGSESTIYLGAKSKDAVGSLLQDLDTEGIYTLNLILFGYIDNNDNQVFDIGVDDPYSQNLPYQGLVIE